MSATDIHTPPRIQEWHASRRRAWLKSIPVIALLGANLLIVAQALKVQWGFVQILYICWFEAIIIAAFSFLKMVVVIFCGHPFGPRFGTKVNSNNRGLGVLLGLLALGFFVVKFAGFALATGFLLLLAPVGLTQLETGHKVAGSQTLLVMSDSFQSVTDGLPPVLIGLLISHGISFVVNFLFRREYQRTELVRLVFSPYLRMGLAFVVLFVIGFATAGRVPLAGTTFFAVMVVLMKIGADLITHLFEHSPKPPTSALGGAPPSLRSHVLRAEGLPGAVSQ